MAKAKATDGLVASAQRLHEVAKHFGVIGPTAISEDLLISQQVVTNWGARGVSKDGALAAEKKWGCVATWVLEGDGPQWIGGVEPVVAPPVRPTLEQALAVIGQALSSTMDADLRDDVADAMRKLALREGSPRDQKMVLHLLGLSPGKRRRAAA